MRERAKLVVRGVVQGVGFRPHVYRLATELQLNGWVLNSAQGVFIEVEGRPPALRQFLVRLGNEKPPRAVIQSMEVSFLDAIGYQAFEIRYSDDHGEKTVLILPDVATCTDCLREIFEPGNRRYRYPFTNCTNCGPRFSIIEKLPYDRPNTSMKQFTMCPDCDREYHDPQDRRFHAQPNACPRCGPQLALWDPNGATLARRDDALTLAADAVRAGRILAFKGLGGFQLMVDARSEQAVRRLRERKRREEKPFGLMYPSLEAVREDCHASGLEERLLLAPESPIVLLAQRRAATSPAPSVAPGNPTFGVMLPYTPLHHLLIRDLGFPIVATSGNLSDEPICTGELEALERLRGIADFFLVHDRPIVRHVDDSVVRVVCGRELVLRRARGYAPLPVHLQTPLPCVLAVGAHLKNSVALSVGTEVFISQHIGDLETGQAWAAFQKVAADLPRLYEANPVVIACDLHPDYLSTKYAARLAAPVHRVQHHWAHALACMAENELAPPVLAVSWDGTGSGLDGTVWGGEFLLAGDGQAFRRVAHFRQFRLPGGEAAIKQPRRTALGVLFAMWGDKAMQLRELAPVHDFSDAELRLIRQTLAKGLHAPVTSSAGRLFDAVASIAGLRQRVSFEGQAAMDLEFAIAPGINDAYPFGLDDPHNGRPCVVDWRPAIQEMIDDVREQRPAGVIAARFHNGLAEVVVAVARIAGVEKVALTGGCFQNRYLTERCVERLGEAGFRAYWHQRIPPNDGGIALGQVMAAARAAQRSAGAAKEGLVA